jgi:hypothetical protein
MEEQKYPLLSEVREKKEKHGRLIYCSCYRSHNGMMFNSGEDLNITARRDGDSQNITLIEKEAFQDRRESKYVPKEDIMSELEDFCEKENLAALRELVYHQEYFATDVSSSRGISLWYDDSDVGGKKFLCCDIDLFAVCQQDKDYGDRIEETLISILRKGIAYSVPAPAEKEPTTGWQCLSCGKKGNMGMFCMECGMAMGSK